MNIIMFCCPLLFASGLLSYYLILDTMCFQTTVDKNTYTLKTRDYLSLVSTYMDSYM